MTPERWRQVTELFHAALTREGSARPRYLDEACGDDRALRGEVDAMLAAHPAGTQFGDSPVTVSTMNSPRLAAGATIGLYRVEHLIGSGGMGEVYRARDTRLGRDVAVKVLPAAFTSDADRLARFQREARVLAALNHPHIAAIYGLEETADVRALILELVEGEPLAERVRRGPIPIDQALALARQIAEALEAAHEKGIVHRDLKPANIKVTPDGVLKVLDFGLAKALAGDGTGRDLSAVTFDGTREGVIAGTPAYMSPEQARGQTVDKRTDIWAFGCVLYEMLTARSAFPGHTISDTIAAVLEHEPDWRELPEKTPASVHRVLQRCLEKDPKRRWHAAADVRIEIEAILAEPRGPTVRPEAVAARQPVWRRAIPFAATAVAAAAIATAVAWHARPEPAVAIARFSIVLPDGQRLTQFERHNIAVSPDGQHIVYVANNQLYLRPMGDTEARPIPGTNQDVNTPFFSPDGQWIGFYAVPEGRLKKIAITGGTSVTIAAVANLFGARWEPDDWILVGQGAQGIVRVSANGGTPETIVKAEAGETMHGPQMLPDGEHVLFTRTTAMGNTRWDQAQIVVQSLPSGERTVLINGGSDARYVPTGHIVYALRTNLLAVPFDERSLTVTGGPVPIREGIGRSVPTNDTAAMFFSFSPSGALAYFVGGARETNRRLAFVDRKGESVALPMPSLDYDDPRISPDGTQLAVRVNTESESNIWIYDLGGVLAPRRLTFGGTNTSPSWSPDGRRIAFISNRDDNRNAIFWQAADGSGSAERLTDPTAAQPLSLRFSPDGKIVYRDAHGDGSLWIVPLDGNRQPQLVIDRPGNQYDPSFSPDGRWIAYGSSESGRDALYVQPYPPTGAEYQITAANSYDPLWSPNGRQIFYHAVQPAALGGSLGPLMSVDVRTESSITYANPTRVFDSVLVSGNWPYDVTPDGSRVVVLLGTGDADRENPEIRVTLNWFEELRQRVPR